jgi:UDP-glucose 4-epimerase
VASRFLIVGGAGFIGSHLTDRLLGEPGTERVTLYDNFSSGREWHYAAWRDDPRLDVIRADVHEQERLNATAAGHEVVIHLASNPDIARAVREPSIDFHEGTELTHAVVEAARISGATTLLYPSGSGVYGDLGELEVEEDHGPLVPVSTYGASKMAGEALIAAYCHMFGLVGRAFRFGNVVGARQTHGVGLDFLRRLIEDPTRLRILGDGKQSKSYIHVSDVVEAVMTALARETRPFQVYNVATGDYTTVREIADMAVEVLGLRPGSVTYEFTGGDRGWKGDVPVVRLRTDRIRALGWSNRLRSSEALRASLEEMRATLPGGAPEGTGA